MRTVLLLFAACVWAPLCALAQEATPGPPNAEPPRIFGVLPNYGTIETPSSTYSSIDAARKLRLAAQNAFDPMVYPAMAVVAGFTLRYGGGLDGYGKQYAASLADAAAGSLFSAGLAPVLLHQDPRYFRQ